MDNQRVNWPRKVQDAFARMLQMAENKINLVRAEAAAAIDRERAKVAAVKKGAAAAIDCERAKTATMREELDVAREETAALRKELDVAREETAALRNELDVAREETAALRNELDVARVETTAARKAAQRREEKLQWSEKELTWKLNVSERNNGHVTRINELLKKRVANFEACEVIGRADPGAAPATV